MTNGARDGGELLHVQLEVDERQLLRQGLIQWGGPALPSDALAVAMGFADLADLRGESSRLDEEVGAGHAMSRNDWTRSLLMTEVIFSSVVLGAGLEWRTVTGLDDKDTFLVLRRLQRKLASVGALVYPGQPGGVLPYASATEG